ncbi:MAG: recombinase family protein [Actinomycetota bacterium]|nr:recombinase family protein [Actinomycetota bacterium]
MSTESSSVGYARCSMATEDLKAQWRVLRELGVAADRIYLDQSITGVTTDQPGLDQALAALREGDTLVVPKLDRLARSVPEACAIAEDLAHRGVTLSLGGQSYDPTQAVGKVFFDVLATIATFEVDLLRMRSREGLTGLSTKAATIARLEATLGYPRVHGPYTGVLFCDIDDFAAIGRKYGRPVGDVVLAILAMRVRNCVRQGDTVGRVGDDEALLILPGVHGLDNVVMVGDKIRDCATEPIDYAGATIQTSLSVGATLAVPGESAAALIARAESALRAAKRAGKNTVSAL